MLNNFSYVVPGKLAGCAYPGIGGRLEDAVRELDKQGVGAVVSLVEFSPAAEVFEQQGLAFLHQPIMDFSPPTLEQMRRIETFALGQIKEGRSVMAHCSAGQGRTGTVLACLLLSLGHCDDGASAINAVRRVRPGSIETPEQEAFILQWESEK